MKAYRIVLLILLCAAATVASPAQEFTVITTFDINEGYWPSRLVQGLDGNLYGTGYFGGDLPCYPAIDADGIGGCGTVFRISLDGTVTTLHKFKKTDGMLPSLDGMILATDGNFYGTTTNGGSEVFGQSDGTIFGVTPEGVLTTLHSFGYRGEESAGAYPQSTVIQATDGDLYGTTITGGNFNGGTVFRSTLGGETATIFNFNALGFRGLQEPLVALVQANNGDFYGATLSGGANSNGVIFAMKPAGELTPLYSFCAGPAAGSYPPCPSGYESSALVQGPDGNLYGTTAAGGIQDTSLCLVPNGCGTFFRVTTSGKLTTLYKFCAQGAGCPDGIFPMSGSARLLLASDGNFYGVTGAGAIMNSGCGDLGCGTLFRITPTGKLTTLHKFCSEPGCADGYGSSGLMQATDGKIYGGGFIPPCTHGNCSVIFKLSTGLPPFVPFIQNLGKVGQTVQILGQGFTGATGVSFNGTPATFTVQSDTNLTATVPAGAEPGFVTVTTPTGTLKSNVPFRVTPQIFSNSPTSGAVGTTVVITGISLGRTYAITFGGVRATEYTLDSDTQITVTVPAGAQKGKIAVLTPGGTADSPTCFDVTP